MLVTDFSSSDSLVLDLALRIVEDADTWAVEDDASPCRHSHHLAVMAIARRLVAADGPHLEALVKEHMSHPRRRQTGAAHALHEWRQQRPVEVRRIAIRLDLSRAETDEERESLRAAIGRLDGR